MEAILGLIWDAFLDGNWDVNWDADWDDNYDGNWDTHLLMFPVGLVL